MNARALAAEYKTKRRAIKQRLNDFKKLYNKSDKDIFEELCFCILTPQSKALLCDKAVKELKKSKLLFKGSARAISESIKGRARFHNNKAAYIKAARKFFLNSKKALDIKSKLDKKDPYKTRDWLVKNIKGLGYKEASHFLRNIGLGSNMAIFDVHILKNLKMYNVIGKIPNSMSRKNYLQFEEKMIEFAKRINIPVAELDLLFWSMQTGYIFR